MVEKDIIETKISEGKEKAEEKIDEHKEKAEEKINYRKEKLNEKREQTKNMAEKMTEDLSRGFDDLQEGIKSIQKIIDQKIDDYKKATIHSLDVDLIETEEKYYLKVDVPGIEKEEIDKKVAKNDFQIEDILGDMVICIPKVEEQAEEYGHSFERELAYMLVHGFYHLMGYDHIKEDDKKVMREKEEKVLKDLNINRE